MTNLSSVARPALLSHSILYYQPPGQACSSGNRPALAARQKPEVIIGMQATLDRRDPSQSVLTNQQKDGCMEVFGRGAGALFRY